jgi:carbon storage regulator CsrA
MLVLDRKEQQSIVIDGPAKITVQRIKGGRIKLGIEADKSVKVLRGELIKRDRDAA